MQVFTLQEAETYFSIITKKETRIEHLKKQAIPSHNKVILKLEDAIKSIKNNTNLVERSKYIIWYLQHYENYEIINIYTVDNTPIFVVGLKDSDEIPFID